MPRTRKVEREAVVRALSGVHDTIEDAADSAILALDEARRGEMSKTVNRPFCVLMQSKRGGMIFSFEPYPTESIATRAIDRLCSPLKIDDHAAGVLRLYSDGSE